MKKTISIDAICVAILILCTSIQEWAHAINWANYLLTAVEVLTVIVTLLETLDLIRSFGKTK